ncbi:hypothetical protein JW898_00260 [Candidatus Woesearchaeota archaeon]|nr:hypothetical protein [Candidatus Woesearchaeota archaeon]
MYPELEDCEHVMAGLYDYALEHRLPAVAVDNEIISAYWQHRKRYDRLLRRGGPDSEAKLRELNVHVLEGHVLSELERMAAGKKR